MGGDPNHLLNGMILQEWINIVGREDLKKRDPLATVVAVAG